LSLNDGDIQYGSLMIVAYLKLDNGKREKITMTKMQSLKNSAFIDDYSYIMIMTKVGTK